VKACLFCMFAYKDIAGRRSGFSGLLLAAHGFYRGFECEVAAIGYYRLFVCDGVWVVRALVKRLSKEVVRSVSVLVIRNAR